MSDLHTMNDVVNGLRRVIDQREATIRELTKTVNLLTTENEARYKRIKELEELRREAYEVAYSSPELNMANYSFDDVSELNFAMSELCGMLEPPQHATKEDNDDE